MALCIECGCQFCGNYPGVHDQNHVHPFVSEAQPYAGHPRFYEILEELRDLHDRKNHDYAAGGKPTGNFDRRAALLRLYPGLTLDQNYKVAAFDILKQLDAALWMLCQGHESQTGEGVSERLRDVACYAILAELMYEERYVVDTQPGS